jgi:hypothetical protein
MKPKEDFEGNPLEIHDKVVFIPYKGGNIRKGKVVGFSPQNIRMETTGIITWGNKAGDSYTTEYLRPSGHVCKI